MDPALRNRILSRLREEFPGYPPLLQRVAKYILDRPSEFGIDPVRVTAEKVGVSTYTLVRLAKALGFDGFRDLRAPFRHALVSKAPPESGEAWRTALRKEGETGAIIAESGANSLALAEASLRNMRPEDVEAAVRLMIEAPTVYVLGMRASYALAYYLNYVGRMALPSLQLVPRHMNSPVDELNDARDGDVLIAISVAPYSRETIESCVFAQARGVRLILISDSPVVSPDLDPVHVFTAHTLSTHHFACVTGLTAVIEILLAAMVAAGGEAARSRIRSYENLREFQGAYWARPKKH